MPKFNDSSYPKLTGIARNDRLVAADISQADPTQITRYLEVQDMLAHTFAYASMAVRTTMSGTLTLLDTDSAYQSLDPNGSNRTVNLPTAAVSNHPYMIANRSATYTLDVKSGATSIVIVQPGDTRIIMPDGTLWVVVASGTFAKEIHAATSKATPVDADELGIWDSVTATLNKLTWANLKATLKTYFDTLYTAVNTVIPNNGWVSPGETWTYASASTFTVSGDKRTTYKKGTKLKWTQSAAVKYGVVVAVSYSSPNTTVTILVNTNWTIANSAITANYYSYVENPGGWNFEFDWTPSWTNLSVGNGTIVSKLSIEGEWAEGNINLVYGSTTSITGAVSFAVPVAANGYGGQYSAVGGISMIDTGNALYMGEAVLRQSLGSIEVRVINASGTYAVWNAISGTVPFTWAVTTNPDELDINFRFHI